MKFINSAPAFEFSTETARVLDDMRFLTTTILSFRNSPNNSTAMAKFLATAKWIHTQLTAAIDPSLKHDFIYQTCRATAIMYSKAIISRTPLSRSGTPELLKQLWIAQWSVPLARWKEMIGIYFWITLVSSPYSRDRPEGKWQKSIIACITTVMGLVDWDVTIGILRAFLAVQRWLEGDMTGSIIED